MLIESISLFTSILNCPYLFQADDKCRTGCVDMRGPLTNFSGHVCETMAFICSVYAVWNNPQSVT